MRIRRNHLPAFLLLWAQPAAAAPLDPQACSALNTERNTLIGAGIKGDMQRGPIWAKANLDAERLAKIERLIAVEEQLSFRCGQQVTAAPQIKEPPKPPPSPKGEAKPADDVFTGLGLVDVPPPKKKATKKQ
jgi:hypothetical protein